MSAQHHSKAPVRVTLADVAARHRRLMASERATVEAPPTPRPAPAPARPAAPPQTIDERRAALTMRLAAIQGEMRSAGGARRAALTAELIRVQASLSGLRAELRAQYAASERPKLPIIQALLEIIDRYQDAGAPLSDDEVATLNRAAEWLESNGGGDR